MSRYTRKHPDAKLRPRHINRTIDEVIADFANEKFKQGIDGVMELASWWKSAGAGRESFLDLCQYIEREAAALHDEPQRLRLQIGKEIRAAMLERKRAIVVPGNQTKH
jgi:hypothetical protein